MENVPKIIHNILEQGPKKITRTNKIDIKIKQWINNVVFIKNHIFAQLNIYLLTNKPTNKYKKTQRFDDYLCDQFQV